MCTDFDAPTALVNCGTLGQTVTGFGSGPNKVAERTGLCPTLLAIGNASCAALSDVPSLAALLEPAAKAPRCCRLQWSGIANAPLELAAVLVHVASRQRHAADAASHRFLSTASGNGWVSCIFAAYLQRYHGVPLAGLAVNGGKSEWSMSGDTRHLFSSLGLTYRGEAAFDAEADLALLAYDPRTRSSIMPSSFSARALSLSHSLSVPLSMPLALPLTGIPPLPPTSLASLSSLACRAAEQIAE